VRKKKPRRHVSPGLGLLGVDKGKGELRGATSKLVSIDNARVARKFPRTSERVRDGRRCHTSAGGKCDTGTRAASVGRLSRPAGALDCSPRLQSPSRHRGGTSARRSAIPAACLGDVCLDVARDARRATTGGLPSPYGDPIPLRARASSASC
jgi:hypothetical protein